jgi:hypothetical protein
MEAVLGTETIDGKPGPQHIPVIHTEYTINLRLEDWPEWGCIGL